MGWSQHCTMIVLLKKVESKVVQPLQNCFDPNPNKWVQVNEVEQACLIFEEFCFCVYANEDKFAMHKMNAG